MEVDGGSGAATAPSAGEAAEATAGDGGEAMEEDDDGADEDDEGEDDEAAVVQLRSKDDDVPFVIPEDLLRRSGRGMLLLRARHALPHCAVCALHAAARRLWRRDGRRKAARALFFVVAAHSRDAREPVRRVHAPVDPRFARGGR